MTILANRARSIRPEDAQVLFDVGDRVRFLTADGGTLTSTVEKLNPKRARVQCGDVMWSVPYARLSTDCRPDPEPPEG